MKHWTKEQIKPGALPITREELIALGVPAEAIEKGAMHGKLDARGPWGIPVSYMALCMSVVWTPEGKQRFTAERESATAYGLRVLSSIHQSGHQLEGRVSVKGRRVRGFTSSQLFELPDGKLVEVAIIHACLNDKK